MRKIFLITVLLSFAFAANNCSDDETTNCSCQANKDQVLTELTGLLYRDSSIETGYYIYQGNLSMGTFLLICNEDFLNTLNSLPNEQDSFLVKFSAVSTEFCPQEEVSSGNNIKSYINLTQIQEE